MSIDEQKLKLETGLHVFAKQLLSTLSQNDVMNLDLSLGKINPETWSLEYRVAIAPSNYIAGEMQITARD